MPTPELVPSAHIPAPPRGPAAADHAAKPTHAQHSWRLEARRESKANVDSLIARADAAIAKAADRPTSAGAGRPCTVPYCPATGSRTELARHARLAHPSLLARAA